MYPGSGQKRDTFDGGRAGGRPGGLAGGRAAGRRSRTARRPPSAARRHRAQWLRSRPMSKAGADCVMALVERRSAPAAA